MSKKYSLLIALFISALVNGQENEWLAYPTNVKNDSSVTKGKIVYNEDNRTQKLIDHMAMPMPPEYKVMIDGYRVQIFFSNDREIINKQRENFQRNHPDVETYVQYDAPNYSIKVGNFRTEIAAEEMRQRISGEFPSSIIQKTKIELPKIKPAVILEGLDYESE